MVENGLAMKADQHGSLGVWELRIDSVPGVEPPQIMMGLRQSVAFQFTSGRRMERFPQDRGKSGRPMRA